MSEQTEIEEFKPLIINLLKRRNINNNTSTCYIDHSVNRINSEGMLILKNQFNALERKC